MINAEVHPPENTEVPGLYILRYHVCKTRWFTVKKTRRSTRLINAEVSRGANTKNPGLTTRPGSLYKHFLYHADPAGPGMHEHQNTCTASIIFTLLLVGFHIGVSDTGMV